MGTAPLKLICIVLALCLFGISAFIYGPTPAPAPWYGRLVSMGLFFLTLSFLIS
jgi:hypothetical protein